MSINLKNLFFDTRLKYELELLAGESGLDSSLNWIYLMEDISNSSFLHVNDLILTTAMMYDHSENWLLDFIKTLNEKKSCGLILNLGKYVFLSDITPEVIAYCNQNSFPLLTMPWHVQIHDITRDYYDRILVDLHSSDTLDFSKLLFEFSNRDLLNNYVSQKIGVIIDYDLKHNTDLYNTLYLYLLHWGSTQAIARKSYCHRNTITNRIHMLKDKFNCNLEDENERFELLTAIKIREFLSYT